jgi:hypothetical protein
MSLSAAAKAHVDHARNFSRGTMPIAVELPAAELAAAAEYLRGKKWGALVELRDRAKSALVPVERREPSPLPQVPKMQTGRQARAAAARSRGRR